MPTTKYESGSYIFSTDEQLRQDLKKAMLERGFTASALARYFAVYPSTIGRFLDGQNPHPRAPIRQRYINWLNGDTLPMAEPSTPLSSWLTLQSCLIDIAGRTGGLPPDALAAISELNSFFSSNAK